MGQRGRKARDYILGTMLVVFFTAASPITASDQRGQVRFGALPVPGASVQATRSDKTPLRTLTDSEGEYSFADLEEGIWTIEVRAPGFEASRREVTVARDGPPVRWDLKMLTIAGLTNSVSSPGFPKATSTSTLQVTSSAPTETSDRLLINGSVNNGAATPFAQSNAFGNNRRARRSLYTGGILVTGNNSILDARSFSLTGQDTPKPAYSKLQGTITFGGPFKIPSVFRGGNFNVMYNRTQNRNATIQTAQMPALPERSGDFSNSRNPILDPLTGAAFPGNIIPANRVSPQARALLDLYPLPNFTGLGRYNYQIPITGITHGDNIQGSLNNIAINNRDRISGNANVQSTRSDNPDLFGFTDTTNVSTTTGGITWNHRFNQRITGVVRYGFNRTVTETLPYFGRRLDVSGNSGIAGNDRDPRDWGPPALSFAGGIARLSSGSYAFDRSQSHSISFTSNWSHGRHNLAYGADYRKQQFNLLSQKDARGGFTFTGTATGNDFADFLLGIPASSSIAFGNADKYFRQSFANAFVTDDWRLKSSITLTAGVRWEYESPITELYGRLVNLAIAPGFVSATPSVAGDPHESLLQPDSRGFEPRLALAWRPKRASSLVIRAAYGMYRDTNVYRAIADQMAQQSPLSKSLSVQNTASNPLSLADGFRGSASAAASTFAIDPHFRVGDAQNWQASIQHDMPGAMQMTITYLGIKGTHVLQRSLPNTFPAGSVHSCISCATGFVYMTSNGNSNRHAGTVEIRRRQRNGFEGSARYTFSKAIDDAGLGAYTIAQNWLDFRAERALSNFDQRHQVVLQTQYTTGMLARIGTFWDGWRGKLFKEWTLTTQLTAGSGQPLTPVIFAPVNGFTGSLRPNVTGAPIHVQAGGLFLNPAAYAAPSPGEWGNAARNSITGPGQFGLNAALARTFRINDRISMDLRVDSTNVLNHVTFPRWNTTVNSAQFGLPANANAMRTLQPSLRVRF